MSLLFYFSLPLCVLDFLHLFFSRVKWRGNEAGPKRNPRQNGAASHSIQLGTRAGKGRWGCKRRLLLVLGMIWALCLSGHTHRMTLGPCTVLPGGGKPSLTPAGSSLQQTFFEFSLDPEPGL